jgi:hypothetical protein
MLRECWAAQLHLVSASWVHYFWRALQTASTSLALAYFWEHADTRSGEAVNEYVPITFAEISLSADSVIEMTVSSPAHQRSFWRSII